MNSCKVLLLSSGRKEDSTCSRQAEERFWKWLEKKGRPVSGSKEWAPTPITGTLHAGTDRIFALIELKCPPWRLLLHLISAFATSWAKQWINFQFQFQFDLTDWIRIRIWLSSQMLQKRLSGVGVRIQFSICQKKCKISKLERRKKLDLTFLYKVKVENVQLRS